MDGEAVGEGSMGEGPVCQGCEEMRELGGGARTGLWGKVVVNIERCFDSRRRLAAE